MNVKNGIANEDKVTKILGCFESSIVNNWISVNHGRLCALTFEKFIVARQDTGYEFCEVQRKGESERGFRGMQATGLDTDGRQIR
jgi:hypothetical protein